MVNWKLKALICNRYGSQVRAAVKYGISPSELTFALHGYRKPSLKLTRALRKDFGEEVTSLLTVPVEQSDAQN